MGATFDLIVIGTGVGGVTAATFCAREGWSVAIVDALPYGGTCALRGCDPKKILRRGPEIVEAARLMQGKGIEAAGLRIDWRDLVAFKRSFTEAMPGKIESSLSENGVSTLHGRARLVRPTTVEIDGEAYEARRILIATGARPRPLDIPGAEHLATSDGFMEVEQLPERVLFVGGGFVSFEFAHMAARAGSEAHVLQRGDRVLKAFDPDLVDKLVARGRSAGIHVHFKAAVQAVERNGSDLIVTADVDGRRQAWTAGLVVHGAGRIADLDGLDLKAAGIEVGASGVAVNDYLQSTSNPAVYAAGDSAATHGPPLTPVAVLEGEAAAANMLHGNKTVPDYEGVPSVVFTIPELARVGLLESQAKERGLAIRVAVHNTGAWYSNLRVGESCAAAKVILDRNSDRVLGAHLLGPECSELVNLFALAIRLRLTAGDLRRLVSAYPTHGSDLSSLLH